MDRRIEETVRHCAGSLHDDWALEQEVAQELRSHLEERTAELENSGMVPDESVSTALHCFGEPEEIRSGLLWGNLRRMRLRARVRLAVRILALPALLAGAYCTLNLGVLDALVEVRELCLSEQDKARFPLPDRLIRTLYRAVSPELGGETRLLCGEGGTHQETAAMRRELARLHPDDPVYQAEYGVYAVGYGREGELSPGAVEEIVAARPSNALYYYLAAGNRLQTATEAVGKPPQLAVKDRGQFDAAMEDLKKALACPVNTDYLAERMERKFRLLAPGDDFRGLATRLRQVFTVPLPQLSVYRAAARAQLLYAGILIGEGRAAEAEWWLRAWRPLTRQALEDTDTVIGILVVRSILEMEREQLPELYDRLGKSGEGREAAAAIDRVLKPVGYWLGSQKSEAHRRTKEEWDRKIRTLGGWFSPVVWQDPEHPLDSSLLAADRGLAYGVLDSLAATVFGTLLAALILLLSLLLGIGWVLKRRGRWLALPWREWARLLLWGAVVPVGIYLLWIRLDGWNGRELGIFSNPQAWVPGIALVIGLPLWFRLVLRRILRRRYRLLAAPAEDGKPVRLPFFTDLCNAIPAWLLLLLLAGGTLRLASELEMRRQLERDTLFRGSLISTSEDRWWRENRSAMLAALDGPPPEPVPDSTPAPASAPAPRP